MQSTTQFDRPVQLEFQVLDCVNSIPGDDHGYYRILIPSLDAIRYLRFFSPHSIVPDFRGLNLGFRTVPGGRWNCAKLAMDTSIQKYAIASLGTMSMESIRLWHPRSVDVKALGSAIAGPADGEVLCQDKIQCAIFKLPAQLETYQYRVNHTIQNQAYSSFSRSQLYSLDPRGDQDPQSTVFAHYSWWPSEVYGPSHESYIHFLIERRLHQTQTKAHKTSSRSSHSKSFPYTNSLEKSNSNRTATDTYTYTIDNSARIAPAFLAHLTENNSRVIGYITENIHGRVAEPKDLHACQATLRKLHDIGIAYGDISAEGFLVVVPNPYEDSTIARTSNGPQTDRVKVLLHSFGAAYETNDQNVFDREMHFLGRALEESARRRRREKRGIRM